MISIWRRLSVWLLLWALFAPPEGLAAEPFPSIALFEWQGDGITENGFRDGILKDYPDARFYVYNAAGNSELFETLLQVALERRHDLFYVTGAPLAHLLLDKVDELPVVFTQVRDPIAEGLIASWHSSENNATGISNQVPLLNQLKALKRVCAFERLAVIYQRSNAESLQQIAELKRLQSFLGYELFEHPVASAEEALAVDFAQPAAVDAVFLPHDPLVQSLGSILPERINRAGIPSLAADMSMVTHHRALLGLVPDNYRIGRLAALSALKILEGAHPTDVPSRSLDFFMVSLNMQTAKKLQVQIPLSLLVIADTIVR